MKKLRKIQGKLNVRMPSSMIENRKSGQTKTLHLLLLYILPSLEKDIFITTNDTPSLQIISIYQLYYLTHISSILTRSWSKHKRSTKTRTNAQKG